MKFIVPLSLSAAAVTVLAALPASAHDGRRFQIEVVDNQLVAQGVSTVDDFIPAMAPFNETNQPIPLDVREVRSFTNSMHGHWENSPTPFSILPGYDIGAGGQALTGFDVFWTLTGASKWTGITQLLVDDPNDGISLAAQLPAGTVPNLVPLDANEVISISYVDAITGVVAPISTSQPGTVAFVDDFDGDVQLDADGMAVNVNSNGYDIDPEYLFLSPDGVAGTADTIFVLESVLSTNAPGIADSETVYTILSPGGMGPVQRLHYPSLFLEEFLGTPIPEPSIAALALGGLLLRRRAVAR
ncbi:MAG: hypothetical protein AAF743_08300 [Planctomycetota bacterium]